MEYTVIIHTAEEGGYWVEVPALPGCLSQGETIDEALANVREAIELHLRRKPWRQAAYEFHNIIQASRIMLVSENS